MQSQRVSMTAVLLLGLLGMGCASPYHTDRGALFGGLMGAGLGTAVGAATGDPLAGAAIGGVAGTMTGAVVGGALDNIEARNQAAIAAQMGQRAPTGAVSTADIIAMTQSGVREDVIATHIRNHGIARPLTTNDIIFLQQNGVSPTVIQTAQTVPPPGMIAATPPPTPVYVASPPPPAIVVDPFYHGPHYHHHHRHRHRHHHHGPGVSWGISVSSDDF